MRGYSVQVPMSLFGLMFADVFGVSAVLLFCFPLRCIHIHMHNMHVHIHINRHMRIHIDMHKHLKDTYTERDRRDRRDRVSGYQGNRVSGCQGWSV